MIDFCRCIKNLINNIFSNNYNKYNSVDTIELDNIELSESITNKNNKCAICFEFLSDKDYINLSDCSHRIHINCINKWLINNSECKICFQKLDYNIKLIRHRQSLYNL